jgi:hypothetical protein
MEHKQSFGKIELVNKHDSNLNSSFVASCFEAFVFDVESA